MPILVLVGVYLVFKVITNYEKLHQDNDRSTARYLILWEVMKCCEIIENVLVSSQRDNSTEYQKRTATLENIVFSRVLIYNFPVTVSN